jgi:ATP-binding cassette, subfamily F, member 3
MLSVHQISKIYGIHTVLQKITFSIKAADRIGLIGPNGSGKSTLMRILIGLEMPDSGTVAKTRPDLKIGYLPQGLELDPHLTIAQACELDLPADPDAALAEIASALAVNPSDQGLQTRYDELVKHLSTVHHSDDILNPLGLADIDRDKKVGSLSGGQKTRLMLARLMLEEPNLLLLDEPTNHLDIAMLEWLEGWLNSFPGAALIISHDRTFLDHTVNCILELNPDTHTLREYTGNYSQYLEQFLVEREKQWDEYRDQVAEVRHMRQDINRTKQQALNVELTTTSRQPGTRRYAKKVAQKALSRQKKLDRYLNSDKRVEKPVPGWQLKLDFTAPEHQSRDVLVTEKLVIGYPGYSPLMENINITLRGGERVALTGANGCGKTTVLRTIAGYLEPVAGSVRLGASVKLGYMTQEQEHLDLNKSPLDSIMGAGIFTQTEARHFLHYFLFSGDDPLRPAKSLSYGERTRLELALLVAQGSTFLLLDEPINHLDIPSRARFEQSLVRYTGTVLAVIHDRYFIDHFATKVWMMEEGRIRQM